MTVVREQQIAAVELRVCVDELAEPERRYGTARCATTRAHPTVSVSWYLRGAPAASAKPRMRRAPSTAASTPPRRA